MSEQKRFKIGDRIVCNGFLGQVINVDDSFAEEDEPYYDVEWDDGEVETVKESDIQLIGPKTAFLLDLKGLLEKYGACIYDYEQYKLIVDFDNGDSVSWYWGDKPMKECMLTAHNIMYYDKE